MGGFQDTQFEVMPYLYVSDKNDCAGLGSKRASERCLKHLVVTNQDVDTDEIEETLAKRIEQQQRQRLKLYEKVIGRTIYGMPQRFASHPPSICCHSTFQHAEAPCHSWSADSDAQFHYLQYIGVCHLGP